VSKSVSSLEPFTENLLAVFRTFHKNDRVILPLMKTLDLLLSNGAFDIFIPEERSATCSGERKKTAEKFVSFFFCSHGFPSSLLALMKAEVLRSKDAMKLMTSINV
jgi:hypothetical protein